MRPIAVRVSTLILAATVALAAFAAEPPDPWVGKSRAEVVERLGEPTKEKSARDGTLALVYRLHRLREGAVPGPRTIVVEVPGVGTLVRVLPRDMEEAVLEPTAIDGDRALKPGGIAEQRGGSTTYDAKTGEIRRDWDPDDSSEVGRKVKLTFELGADGRVEAWSVAPKRARR